MGSVLHREAGEKTVLDLFALWKAIHQACINIEVSSFFGSFTKHVKGDHCMHNALMISPPTTDPRCRHCGKAEDGRRFYYFDWDSRDPDLVELPLTTWIASHAGHA